MSATVSSVHPAGVFPDRPEYRLTWTPHADAQLIRMRLDGLSLRAMASALRLSRSSVARRACDLGLTLPATPIRLRSQPCHLPELSSDRDREPLRAGHPLSWNAITKGTSLDGVEYQHPDPARLRRPARKAPSETDWTSPVPVHGARQ